MSKQLTNSSIKKILDGWFTTKLDETAVKKSARRLLQDAAIEEDDEKEDVTKTTESPPDKKDLKVKGDAAPTPADKPVKDVQTSSTISPDDLNKMKTGEIELSDIEERLNAIRSGKSFKDSVVSAGMEKYFSKLDTPEKTALYNYLVSISQIVTATISGDAVPEPSDPPADVTMQKDGHGKKKIQIKPLINKGSHSSGKKNASEDTSGPLPIKPK